MFNHFSCYIICSLFGLASSVPRAELTKIWIIEASEKLSLQQFNPSKRERIKGKCVFFFNQFNFFGNQFTKQLFLKPLLTIILKINQVLTKQYTLKA